MDVPGNMIPIVLFTSIAVTIIGFPLARAFARRIEQVRPPAIPPDVHARLVRMEQAIDAIAVEVERIAEGQRFTTKVLSSRAEGAHARDAALPPG